MICCVKEGFITDWLGFSVSKLTVKSQERKLLILVQSSQFGVKVTILWTVGFLDLVLLYFSLLT